VGSDLGDGGLLAGFAEVPAPASPAPGDGAGGLHDGAGAAGEQNGDTADATSLTDDKLAALLKQIFASNQQARDKVEAIMADIAAKSKQIGPELGDPASLVSWQKYVDGKFREIHQLLSDSQVDAKTQAAIMDALGDEYRGHGQKTDEGGSANEAGGNGSGDNAVDANSPTGDGGTGPADSGAAEPAVSLIPSPCHTKFHAKSRLTRGEGMTQQPLACPTPGNRP
jgi:hypothetical protein